MRKRLLVLLVGLWLGMHSSTATSMSTVFGGSLLRQGEVTLSFGAGFPDIFFQFDFANADEFNMALAAKFNYNLGFPLFGANFFGLVPLRFALVQGADLSLALKLEPGIFVGFGYFKQVFLGGQVGVGLLGSYQIIPKLALIFGLEVPLLLSFELSTKEDIFGANIPIEFMAGMEYRINNDFSLFLKLSGGPFLYIGNLAHRLTASTNSNLDVMLNGIVRFVFGLEWRR